MPHANFTLEFNPGWKLMWPTLILNMEFSMGSWKLLWPTLIGLFSVPTYANEHALQLLHINLYVLCTSLVAGIFLQHEDTKMLGQVMTTDKVAKDKDGWISMTKVIQRGININK